MQFSDLQDKMEELAEELLEGAKKVPARQCGLDDRSFGVAWVNEDADCLIVRKSCDRTLQYYGGFEYVDKDCRAELGSYVVYSNEDGRVADAIDRALGAEE